MRLFARGISTGILVLAIFISVACSGPTYKTEYYTLVADAKADLLVEQRYSGSLGVGPIRTPDILNHSGIVSHGSDQQVFVAPYQVWAGDLKRTITRVLADDLSAYLGTHQVWPFPRDNRVRPDRQISILFERFDGERGGEVVLQAKWRLLTADAEKELHTAKVTLRTQTQDGSYSAYVQALNQLLDEFAGHLALAIAELERGND